mmetsp:Transcript_48700/g.72723  ORF Transcript_48700/g.72723 Transcript_48700/m.72723 type:complete len:171 (-) Transcript_48700:240-752(-)
MHVCLCIEYSCGEVQEEGGSTELPSIVPSTPSSSQRLVWSHNLVASSTTSRSDGLLQRRFYHHEVVQLFIATFDKTHVLCYTRIGYLSFVVGLGLALLEWICCCHIGHRSGIDGSSRRALMVTIRGSPGSIFGQSTECFPKCLSIEEQEQTFHQSTAGVYQSTATCKPTS